MSLDLAPFVAWCAEHIRGDEKGEAQLFLDHLFRAFGHAGLKEAGATCEDRIKKDGGGTAFADLVWKPVVLVEMKKRGVDLSKHYRQSALMKPLRSRTVKQKTLSSPLRILAVADGGTAPGIPAVHPEPERLLSADCLGT